MHHRHAPTRLMLCLLLFAAPATLHAQDAPRCFMWKISSPTTTVYLLGSVHMARQKLYPLDRAIEGAFTRSDRLVVELDTAKLDPQIMAQRVRALGMYPPGQTLEQNVKASTWNKLKAYVQKFGLPAAAFNPMRPWMVSTNLTTMTVQSLGYKQGQGIDAHFIKQAKQSQKPILELETAQQQLQAMAAGDAAEQEKGLLMTLEQMEQVGPLMKQVFELWEAGDAEGIDKAMLEPYRVDPDLKASFDRMFVARNKGMAEKIEGYLASGETHFVVVGAGHLAGKQSVVDLLSKSPKKYKIEQVEQQGKPDKKKKAA